MPDIAMCIDEDCPIRFDCYRFTAKPTKGNQSYANFKYIDEAGCESWVTNHIGIEERIKDA